MLMFSGLRALALKNAERAIDNWLFRLHYRLTAILLISAALLVTSQEHFGTPITCGGPSTKELPSVMLDNFCWTRSTFTLPDSQMTDGQAYPGVSLAKPGEPVKYLSYYQWVWLVLFFQAIAFYLPRYFWKKGEGGKVKSLTCNLTTESCLEARDTDRERRLVEHVWHMWHHLDSWCLRYFVCEVLNFANAVGQIFAIDRFLNYTFLKYGTGVVDFTMKDEQESRTDPMITIFPRLSKCTFHYFGPSGDIQNIDLLCVLPLNILNEKIYIVLWFWLIILAIPSGLVLLYRVLLFLSPKLRYYVLRLRFRHIPANVLQTVVYSTRLGDWLLISFLGKNLDPRIFENLIQELSEKLEEPSIPKTLERGKKNLLP